LGPVTIDEKSYTDYDFVQDKDTENSNISDATLSMKSNRITDLGESVLDSDAATKGRVDAVVTCMQ
jgi:hypothetical protein